MILAPSSRSAGMIVPSKRETPLAISDESLAIVSSEITRVETLTGSLNVMSIWSSLKSRVKETT